MFWFIAYQIDSLTHFILIVHYLTCRLYIFAVVSVVISAVFSVSHGMMFTKYCHEITYLLIALSIDAHSAYTTFARISITVAIKLTKRHQNVSHKGIKICIYFQITHKLVLRLSHIYRQIISNICYICSPFSNDLYNRKYIWR